MILGLCPATVTRSFSFGCAPTLGTIHQLLVSEADNVCVSPGSSCLRTGPGVSPSWDLPHKQLLQPLAATSLPGFLRLMGFRL